MIFLPEIDCVVDQHLIAGLYDEIEERQQSIFRLSGRSTSLVSGVVPVAFLVVQVSVLFCSRSSSSCSSTCLLIVVRFTCHQFSGSEKALGALGWLCVLYSVTLLHKSQPPSSQ